MQTVTLPSVQRMLVHDEHDVISLRQSVRQMARAAGLGLPKQARITAAISEIARMLLLNGSDVQFTLRVCLNEPRPALEVSCRLPGMIADSAADPSGHTPLLGEACSLVDEWSPAQIQAGTLLTLRMWINQS
jgi:hypothetical protein